MYADFQKAFDHIDHNLLIRQIGAYGFSNALIILVPSRTCTSVGKLSCITNAVRF